MQSNNSRQLLHPFYGFYFPTHGLEMTSSCFEKYFPYKYYNCKPKKKKSQKRINSGKRVLWKESSLNNFKSPKLYKKKPPKVPPIYLCRILEYPGFKISNHGKIRFDGYPFSQKNPKMISQAPSGVAYLMDSDTTHSFNNLVRVDDVLFKYFNVHRKKWTDEYSKTF